MEENGFTKYSNLFPAYAGVIPEAALCAELGPAFPRTCGGDPPILAALNGGAAFSPHMRG